MALDNVGQCLCRNSLDRSFDWVSWYAANFGSYNKTYGSLAAIVVFMTVALDSGHTHRGRA